jgi:hypothetical protein
MELKKAKKSLSYFKYLCIYSSSEIFYDRGGPPRQSFTRLKAFQNFGNPLKTVFLTAPEPFFLAYRYFTYNLQKQKIRSFQLFLSIGYGF